MPTNILSTVGDLEVTVWASSPDLRNPTNFDVDRDGRIWVAEGVNYRWSKGRDPKGDRIAVLEDSDGDGKADKSWTFVQEPGLIAPLGVAVIDNKVYVSNTPDLIVYTDVDRNLVFDPRVDKREVLVTGFNGVNHDHSLHSVTFGPDGLLYFNHGNSGALVTDRGGKTIRVGSAYDGLLSGESEPLYGIYPREYAGAKSDDGHVYVGGFAMRMKEDGTNLEVIGHGFRNSYEQTINSAGNIFQNDNDDPPACRTSYLLEYGNTGWFSRDGLRYWQADRRPGQNIPTSQWRQDDPGVIPAGDVYGAGAPTGIAYYESDVLGKDLRGMLLSCEAARNVVFGYLPEVDGAGFKLERFNFLTSNKEEELAGTDGKGGRVSEEIKTFFRPSDVVVGPDGAIYVADWFDPRVGGHSDQDKTASGTIYRIAPKGFMPEVPEFDLSKTDGQIEALKSPAVNVRALGFKALKANGNDSVSAVEELLDGENPYIRYRAIWLLAQLGSQGVSVVESLAGAEDATVRATAYQALRAVDGYDHLKVAKSLASDESAEVRREIAVSMRDVPFELSKGILLDLAKSIDGTDRMALEAWGIGSMGKEAEVYELVNTTLGEEDPINWSTRLTSLLWRLTQEGSVPGFYERASSEELTETDRLNALTAIAFTSSQETVESLFDLIDDEGIVGETAKWWLLNHRNSRYAGFGVSERLKAEGVYDPETIVVSGSVIPQPSEKNYLPVDDVIALEGDVERGAAKASACYACHKVGEAGVEYGPDLNGWASRQSKEATIRAIVNPSDDIAHGFGGREVILKNGTIIHGLIESQGDPLVIQSMGGVRQMIPADRVDRINWYNRSLMLSADQLGLSEQDVADIVSYLDSI
ncbi:PVC-type heme-binding CxxCH protein [Pelagicoccus sp. SDUM812002]|uniref:PVC-type heme-binding CxxCH protein n=1 Tax=Pelagicoccus sp. SDUM812002 TaxID=3041266 RepID=UPI00280E2CB2|nr:PVC-type heme-binding CxxCH protein [Pelagicoccus sp. SDUM812002]MDQ8186652.1 HEAT repeat domain-containing protein [Pelagicoccus sp. SDUM812002]